MLDFSHLPTSTKADVQVFNCGASGSGVGWQTWFKPRGVSMLHILCIGAGGNGGAGAVGAASTAAGGGGGASGAQASLVVPAIFLPDALYLSVSPGAGFSTNISIYPSAVDLSALVLGCASGGNANAASAGTGGGGGGAAAVPAIGSMRLAGLGFYTLLAGQAGITGGAAIAGAALTIPTTGLLVTGGTGGGGVGNGTSTGFAGGAFTVVGTFPPQRGGIPPGSQTVPAGDGSNGYDWVIPGLGYSYGGTGGASTGGAATGAGLKAGMGGAGGVGCGGGGGGGGFTGSTQGLGGRGGPGQIIITAW